MTFTTIQIRNASALTAIALALVFSPAVGIAFAVAVFIVATA